MKKFLLMGLLAALSHDGCEASNFIKEVSGTIVLQTKERTSAAAQKFADAQKAALAKRAVSKRIAAERRALAQKEQELSREARVNRMFDRKPVSRLAVEIFVAQCLGKQTTDVSELYASEYNIDKRRNGAPQIFRVTLDGKNYIVRTVDSIERPFDDIYNPLFCYFNDAKVRHINSTQRELEARKLGISLAGPLNFAAYDLSRKEIRLANPDEVGSAEVQMCLTQEVNGTTLKDIFDEDEAKIGQIIEAVARGGQIDEGMRGALKASFDIGYLVGEAVANLHKIGYFGNGESTTVHGDTTERNVYVDIVNRIVKFIDLDRMGGEDEIIGSKHSIDFEVKSLLITRYPQEFSKYLFLKQCLPSGIPYAVGFLNGYKKAFPAMIPEFRAKTVLDERNEYRSTLDCMIYNIFYRSFGSDVLLGTQNMDASTKDNDRWIFDRLAVAMELHRGNVNGENVNFDTFAKVMGIIGKSVVLKNEMAEAKNAVKTVREAAKKTAREAGLSEYQVFEAANRAERATKAVRIARIIAVDIAAKNFDMRKELEALI
ncbi:hypothetical protein FACS1894122_03760 [Alphaproteobacteria bacterium]|nr:hypothetical protein FACS1894122_03760 [Alphaproteobacteria bacterium]